MESLQQQKASARLSRPYEDQSPLWKAAVFSDTDRTDEDEDDDGDGADDDEPYPQKFANPLSSPFKDLVIPPSISELEAMPSPGMRSPRDEDEMRERLGEQTPTMGWQGAYDQGDAMPDGPISEWDEHGVADWISSLGLDRYHDNMIGELTRKGCAGE